MVLKVFLDVFVCACVCVSMSISFQSFFIWQVFLPCLQPSDKITWDEIVRFWSFCLHTKQYMYDWTVRFIPSSFFGSIFPFALFFLAIEWQTLLLVLPILRNSRFTFDRYPKWNDGCKVNKLPISKALCNVNIMSIDLISGLSAISSQFISELIHFSCWKQEPLLGFFLI